MKVFVMSEQDLVNHGWIKRVDYYSEDYLYKHPEYRGYISDFDIDNYCGKEIEITGEDGSYYIIDNSDGCIIQKKACIILEGEL